jgi:transcriptional regulator with XRE-family HTH domain
MDQSGRIINTLKKCLKARGITYKRLSRELHLSEASIKRIFSEQTFSLKRLEQICNVMDMSFYDLAKLSEKVKTVPSILSVEQEIALAENAKLFIFFYLLLNGRDPDSIVKDYKISSKESLQFLLELDRLKLIELYPGNRVVFLTQKSIEWRKNGPIRDKYEKRVRQEFAGTSSDDPDSRFYFETGKLSEGSRTIMLRKIDRLLKEYIELTEIDKTLPHENNISTGLMVTFRPWVFYLMNDFKRDD